MPRKKATIAPEDNTAAADMSVIKRDGLSFDELNKQLVMVEKTFGDGLPYDEQRLDGVIHNSEIQAGEAFYNMGCVLIRHKAHLPHGRFLEKINNDYSFSPRRGQEMMQAARKFAGPNVRTFAHLGVSKMLAFVSDSNTDINELAEGGTLDGNDMDDVDKMTLRELKAALRKSRKAHEDDNTSNEKLIESKDKKLNTLSKATKNWDNRVKEFNQQATNLASDALEALSRLDDLREAFLHEDFGEEGEAADQAMGCVYYDAVKQIGGRTAQVMEATDTTFGVFADQAMPMLEFWNEKMNQEAEA